MSTNRTGTANLTLALTEEERTELLRLLRQDLGETRVEAHHTHTPGYREGVLKEEQLLRGLIEKIQRLGS